MVDKIGKDSALAREALRAAQKFASAATEPAAPVGAASEGLGPRSAGTAGAAGGTGVDFSSALESGLRSVEQKIDAAEALPLDLLTGKVDDFHEIAVQLKSAELSFRFAMEIRNKLVDAYREIMRMSV